MSAVIDSGSPIDSVAEIVLRQRSGRWWSAFAVAGALLLLLVGATGWLFYRGVGVWGIDWPVSWGFAIINYVWWIGIASGGTFISALFFLMETDWRTSVSRIAETMTVCAAACAGIFPILHLGRPWLFYWLFPARNTMTLWPQFRSPLLWDFFAILAYVTASILFWYFGAIPDLAALRDRAASRRRQIAYGIFAMGFRGSATQWRHYRAVYGTFAAIMAPLVVSVHSIVGLDFAGASTVGWHSTEFPPFFVFGALLSGLAMVLLLLLPLRWMLKLDALITDRHFDVLSRLLLMSSWLVGYAYVMDVFGVYYNGDPAEIALFDTKLSGAYAPVYWATILFNLLLPQLLWSARLRINPYLIGMVSVGVIYGMWCERYSIVVMSLRRTDLVSAWGNYHGTLWDYSLLFGSVGLFGIGLLLAVRYVPTVSMSEVREAVEDQSLHREREIV